MKNMSGEYVVTRKIDKKELKITADPSNQGWSKDTQRFGYRVPFNAVVLCAF